MRSTNSNGSMDGASSGGDQLPPPQQSSAQPANLPPPPAASTYCPDELKRYLTLSYRNPDANGTQDLNQSISFLQQHCQQQQQQQQEGRSAGMPFSTSLSGVNCRRDSHEDNPPKLTKSNNTTECVRVPSSEHVAEIVGRQGCKIKALRAKTNTYIKTPVRGEEPVFVVTGRRDDVSNAVREILSAADHFTAIRAQRRNSSVSSSSNGNGASQGPPSPNTPGQVSCKVKVPYNFVGLVVGPKGQTVKSIQQKTATYIVTPNRSKSPVFDVTGTPDEVRRAAEQIEVHIRERGKVPVVFQRNGLYDYEVVIDQEEIGRRGGVAGSGAVGAAGGVVGGADGLYNFRHNSRREKESSFQRCANGDLPASSPFVTPTYDSWYGSVGGSNLTTDGDHAANGDHFDDNREYFTFDFPNSGYLKDTISALANSTTGSQNFFVNGSASQQRRNVKSDSLPMDELGHYGVDPLEYRNGSASNGMHHSDAEVFHLGSDALLSHDRAAFRQRLLSEGARMSPPRTEWNGASSRDDTPFPLREPRLSAPHKAPNGVQQNYRMRDLFNNYHSFELMNFGNGSPSSLSNGYSNGSTSSLANSFANSSPGALSNGYSNGSTSSMSSNGYSTGLNGMSTPSLPDSLSNGLSNGLSNDLSSGLENGFHSYRNAGGFGPFNLAELGNLEATPLSQQLARMNISCSGSSELPASSVPMPSTSTLCSSSSAPARPITSTYYSSSATREPDLSSCQSSESSPRAGAGNMEGHSSKGGSPLGDLGRSSSEGGAEFACDVCGSHDEVVMMGSMPGLGMSYACSSCANSHTKSPIMHSMTPIDF